MNEKTLTLNADRLGITPALIRKVDRTALSAAPASLGGERFVTGQLVSDQLAIEEPFEILLEYGPATTRVKQSISVTMRTPGFDFELAAGFLFTEGIVQRSEDIERIRYCGPDLTHDPVTNVVRVELAPHVQVDIDRLSRHFYTSSSCGVCGKSSIEALKTQSRFSSADSSVWFESQRIHELPDVLRRSQKIFDSTGGLHASALFSVSGDPLIVREDVGRHNALDKVIGHALIHRMLPLSDFILLVSGRASFELIQKASMAGICVFAAVGAPSSLAVQLAEESGMTLLGFVREDRFNIYSHAHRVRIKGKSS